MGGLLGRLLNEFAVTIAVAILISGFVSLTLTPMLCSRFLRPGARSATAALPPSSGASRARGGYGRALRLVLRHRGSRCCLGGVLVGDGAHVHAIPKGFLPNEDTAASSCRPRPRGHVLHGDGRDPAAGARPSSPPTRTSSRSCRASARAGGTPGEHGHALHQLEAAPRRSSVEA
jgi:hypothetical protein